MVPQHRMVGRLESEKLPPARGDVAPCGMQRLLPRSGPANRSPTLSRCRAQATPSFNVETEGTVILDVSASGGTPPYAYEWSLPRA